MLDKIVLDIETQREFAEVEGRKPELLGISIVGVYFYKENRFDAYTVDRLDELGERLRTCDLIVGFNSRRFDMPVLQPYLPYSIEDLPQLDIMEEVQKVLGHRVSLASCTKATLGVGKSGDGLDAVRWFREGRLDLIAKYCLDDVRITRDLYDFGREQGYIFIEGKEDQPKRKVPLFWPDRKRDLESITKLLQEAHTKCLQVQFEYIAQGGFAADAQAEVHHVDVYHMEGKNFEGFCHERNDIDAFRIERILDIKPTWKRYSIPRGFVPTIVGD